ncbi:ABC transporter ATP-binding protein [Paenibacillus massiliensis]|uniref:ABC transporter ATP-binding protein n=1 Tax=Paenibacillus massiliensis TaxID=225917 RepID=UPI000372D4C8|nr:ABC transporter ATP-binding protein [Paenibacillus massiliensis]
MSSIIDIEHLRVQFHTEEGTVQAVNDVSLSVQPGQTVCIVGESGCGKSVTAMSIMGLIDEQAGWIDQGSICFEGQDLLQASRSLWRSIRGHDISMIFQEPMSSLNPVLKVGEQVMEPLRTHLKMTKKQARERALQLIAQVGISRPEYILDSYPHELSGGMLQRIMIAIAISCGPRLLIADEPTTALDVTIQAQILDMLRQIKDDTGMSMLLITHDLGVVAEMADYVIVMYAGNIVEEGEVVRLFEHPQHPYTQGLLRSKPIMNQRQAELYSIPGQVPNPLTLTDSCHFHERCEYCMKICKTQQPQLKMMNPEQKVACWLYENLSDKEELHHG